MFRSWQHSFAFGDVCTKQVNELSFHGRSFLPFSCPADCAATSSRVWGSAIYTDDSYICAAAIHDGRITDSGGSFRVYKLGGMSLYTAQDQNGISSKSFANWQGSFAFEDYCLRQSVQLDFGEDVSTIFHCPPGCQDTTSRLWGTDIYTDDSYICAAALHGSVITDAMGGVVIVTKSGQRSNYSNSTRNGITSKSYGSWPRSFRVMGM
uniref:Uncharacterized protein LOC100175297 n=1 Tax=Phallusia mammillata TaxID=59560 RepID=A0A6F9DFJ3_9ASCI|nr:uncharacterized protein LOC100175297 [Phallusia mammillata]